MELSIFVSLLKHHRNQDFGIFSQGRTYREISTNPSWSEQYLREAGSKLCKKIKEDLGIKVSKKNFKNPIEFRYKQNELTSPPTPLLQGYALPTSFLTNSDRLKKLAHYSIRSNR
jgi:hypothetical protein